MKFFSATSVLFALFAVAAAAPPTETAVRVSVSYNDFYDDSQTSLSTVACSDGENGMLTKGFDTFGSLSNAPFIGGAGVVTGWNSDMCGTCWRLTYGNTSINVLAINAGEPGTFDIAYAAMNKLTHGRAKQVGSVEATAEQVGVAACGAR